MAGEYQVVGKEISNPALRPSPRPLAPPPNNWPSDQAHFQASPKQAEIGFERFSS